MDNNIIDKRSIWEAAYDELKLETDQNKELVKTIVANMQIKNQKLEEQNNSLLEALKEVTHKLKVIAITANHIPKTYASEIHKADLNYAIYENIIKKAEQ